MKTPRCPVNEGMRIDVCKVPIKNMRRVPETTQFAAIYFRADPHNF